MTIELLTPDNTWVLGTRQELCAGRTYVFTETDMNAVELEWCVTTPDGVDASNVVFRGKRSRTVHIVVEVTGQYDIFNKQKRLSP